MNGTEASLAKLARSQHGLVTRRQALQRGLDRGVIDRALATTRWELVARGVYLLAGTTPGWKQGALGACLAADGGAVASHRTAAALWELPVDMPPPIEIALPHGDRFRRKGVIGHQTRSLRANECQVVDEIPCTGPTRTVIDLAAVVDPAQLAICLDDALRRGLTHPEQIRRRLETLAPRGRKGATTLARLVESRQTVVPESVLETKLLNLVERAALPRPVSQYTIRDRLGFVARVDFAFPEPRVAIEVDGFRFHGGRGAFERDASKRNRLAALGWRILVITAQQLDRHPNDVAATIRAALELESRAHA